MVDRKRAAIRASSINHKPSTIPNRIAVLLAEFGGLGVLAGMGFVEFGEQGMGDSIVGVVREHTIQPDQTLFFGQVLEEYFADFNAGIDILRMCSHARQQWIAR